MTKALFITIASFAAALDSGHMVLSKPSELQGTPANELLVFRRKLSKSDKAGHQIVPPPPPMGKSGKGAKHGAIPPPQINSGWTGSDGDDDDFSHDDGYEWTGSGGDDDGNKASSDGNPSVDDDHDDDDDNASSWMDDGHKLVPSGKGSKEPPMPEQWTSQWSGISNGDDDDNNQAWSGDDQHTKSGKGHKSAKVGKAGKSMKAGKGSHMTEHWGGWGSWPVPVSTVPSPVPPSCDNGDCSEKPGWLPESPTMEPTPCGKAGKECPTPIPPLGPKPSPLPQTLPPICNTIPCSINGVPVSPTILSGSTSGTSTTEPPVPAPIGTVGSITNPPVDPFVEGIISQPPNGTSGNPTVSDVIGAPSPATPPVTPPVPPPVPPAPLVPITVSPTAPTESKYPTFYPTSVPTTTIQTLTTSGTWFQTGKAYEVNSYTRARMGDQNDIGFSFSKQEVTAGSRRLSPWIVRGVAVMAILLGQVEL